MKKVCCIPALFCIGILTACMQSEVVYRAREPIPDDRGFSGEIKITMKNGAIVKAEYNEYGLTGRSKRNDVQYNAGMKKDKSLSWTEAVLSLERSLIETQDPSLVQGVSGATITSQRFKTLAREAVGNNR